MKIKKLTLSNFMAFTNAEIDWSDNINIICGENSTGKTTLLKVMYSLLKPLSNENRENLTKEMEEQLLGVPNVKERLELYYGEKGGMKYDSSSNGTIVTVFLPAIYDIPEEGRKS